MANVEKMIAETFLEMAQGLESGSYGKRPKIALTGMGSEHGEENAMEAALMAAKDGVDVYYIGSLEAEGVTTVKVADDEEGHKKMEEMLANGEVDGAVTMHFPFPIGVSTVGRVVTPAKGREMFVANTTGTSSADRIEGMIKNTIYGIIAAKTCGIANPTVGILNVDGARQTEKALKELQENGGNAVVDMRHLHRILRFYFGDPYMTYIAGRKVPRAYRVRPGYYIKRHRPMTLTLYAEYCEGTLNP